MSPSKGFRIKGTQIGDAQHPLICTPLVGRNIEELTAELKFILEKSPDLIEWRVDFFERIADFEHVIDVAQMIQQSVGNIPLLFTIRAQKEGGESISLSEQEIVQLFTAVCESGHIDMIDYELSNQEENLILLSNVARKTNVKWIASYHNFTLTPPHNVLVGIMKKAQDYRADLVKIAVMSQSLEDVVEIFKLNLYAQEHFDIPFLTISMGQYGVLTRMFGWTLGSSFTFAIGQNSSAPGQVPIDDLKLINEILQKSFKTN